MTQTGISGSPFEAVRGRLFGLAYRMLGSRADAEDIVQEAYVRWHEAGRGSIENPEAWLVTTTSRLAIDRLRRLKTEREAYALNAWRETPFFSERERAALEWTEALTRLADSRVSDELFERVRRQFDEAELVALTFAVIVINGWNRLSISFRPPVGTYQPEAVAV